MIPQCSRLHTTRVVRGSVGAKVSPAAASRPSRRRHAPPIVRERVEALEAYMKTRGKRARQSSQPPATSTFDNPSNPSCRHCTQARSGGAVKIYQPVSVHAYIYIHIYIDVTSIMDV